MAMAIGLFISPRNSFRSIIASDAATITSFVGSRLGLWSLVSMFSSMSIRSNLKSFVPFVAASIAAFAAVFATTFATAIAAYVAATAVAVMAPVFGKTALCL